MADKALVTLLIGDRFQSFWRQWAAEGWRAYAARHGYDLVILDRVPRPDLIAEDRSVHWQKLFIAEMPEVRDYARAVWLDGDILINAAVSPCVVSATPADRIGAVDLGPTYMASEWHHQTSVARMHRCQQALAIYHGKASGPLRPVEFSPAGRPDLNTGVLVFSPERDGPWLAQVFFDSRDDPQRAGVYEQWALSAALANSGRLHCLPAGFNVPLYYEVVRHYPFLLDPKIPKHPGFRDWVGKCLTSIWLNSYFLHVVGSDKTRLLPFIDQAAGDFLDLMPEVRARLGA